MGAVTRVRGAQMEDYPLPVLVAVVTGPLALLAPLSVQILYLTAWVSWGLRRWADQGGAVTEPLGALVLHPGDRVLVAVGDVTAARARDLAAALRERFPDVEFVIAAGVTALAKMPADLEAP